MKLEESMNTFNRIITKFQQLDFQSADSDVLLSFLIENEGSLKNLDISAIHERSVYMSKKSNFSLFFNFHNASPSFFHVLLANQNVFIRLIFHPNFKKSENKPVIFITAPLVITDSFLEYISAFEASIISQGFNGIEWIRKDERLDNISVNGIYEYNNLVSFETMYTKLLSEEFFVASYFSFIDNSQQSVQQIMNSKLKVELQFKKDFPKLYKVLEDYITKSKEIPLLKETLTRTNENLKNQQLYLTLIRAEDEANKINNFYYYEYEILPLWYKKIGHIIKVLTGKRSFRSLFDNNVKKYGA